MSKLRHREAGGIDPQDDLYAMLPSMGQLLGTFDSSVIAHAAYVWEYITGWDNDPRVKQFATKLAEEYAKRFAEWLGYAFLARANRSSRAKGLVKTEEGIAEWVEDVPDFLLGRKNPDIGRYLPKRNKWIDIKMVGAISRKILKVVYADWGAAASGAVKMASMEALPIEFDPRWGQYVIPKSSLTFEHKRELHDLGFTWNPGRGVWFTNELDSDILKALPQARGVQQRRPPTVGPSTDTYSWFFDKWLPSNLYRFDKVFNDYGKKTGLGYEFKFTLTGHEVTVEFKRSIKTVEKAKAELRYQYEGIDRRAPWLQAVSVHEDLLKASGGNAMKAIDRANNLEHTHGSMMEHFPAGIRRWYPAFLDFKFTAAASKMVKKIKDEDLRVLTEEMLPHMDRVQRLAPPSVEHRTPKGLALEISAQKGQKRKLKMLRWVKENHAEVYPQVVDLLMERQLPDKVMAELTEAIQRVASRWMRKLSIHG